MRLVQFVTKKGERRVGIASDDTKGALNMLNGTDSVYQLALDAIARKVSLADLAAYRASGEMIDYDTLATVGRLLAPLDHPHDAAHCLISGAGLTHLGSADARDRMHKTEGQVEQSKLTDSMKLFKLGLAQGKPDPKDGTAGIQPEWFYKGDGDCVIPPGR